MEFEEWFEQLQELLLQYDYEPEFVETLDSNSYLTYYERGYSPLETIQELFID